MLGTLPQAARSAGLPALRRLQHDSLARNSFYIMCNTLFSSFLGYLYWVLAARGYPARDVGLAAALISACMLASNLSNLGIGSTLVQVLPRSAPGRDWSLTLTTGLLLGVLAGLLGGLVLAGILTRFFYPLTMDSVVLVTLCVPLWTSATLLDSSFMAMRAAGNMLMRNLVFTLTKIPILAAPLLLVRHGLSGGFGSAILASWVLSSVVGVVAGWLLVLRLQCEYTPTLRGLLGRAHTMLSSLAGHHFINLGGSAPMYLLPVLVAVRLSPIENAYFYVTWMVGNLFFMVSPAVAIALFAEGSHSAGALRRHVRRSALIIGAVVLPAMVVFLLEGRLILSVFGQNYPRHGWLLLALLTLSAIPDAITNIAVTVLRVRRRFIAAGLLNLCMALLTLVVTWVALPYLGIAAVGWAWLGAQTAGSLAVGAALLKDRLLPVNQSRLARGGQSTIERYTHNG